MVLSGYSAASVFGYSTARVKAMESRLISRETMQSIINAKDVGSIVSTLFGTSYREQMIEFGGVNTQPEFLDFVLSKSLAISLSKLVAATPTEYRSITRAIIGKWDLYNVRIAIEAKGKSLGFEKIAAYIVDYGMYNATVIKDVLREETVEGMLSRLLPNSPYAKAIQQSLDAYRKSRNTLDAIAELDKVYYTQLGRVIIPMKDIGAEAARIAKMDIDMRNALTMIRAKRRQLGFSAVRPLLIEGGDIKGAELERIYESSKEIEEMAAQLRGFDLKHAIEVYKKDDAKRMLTFEVGMRNSIFNSSIKLLRHSVLSFTTILAYMYLKEIEVFTIRILAKGMLYGLSKEEISELITWNL
ncbi:MAG: V-type ATPase subunit [Candidatus Micrarchaeaceae archaeon]